MNINIEQKIKALTALVGRLSLRIGCKNSPELKIVSFNS